MKKENIVKGKCLRVMKPLAFRAALETIDFFTFCESTGGFASTCARAGTQSGVLTLPFFGSRFIATGDYESAVTLLLSTPPDAATFNSDALRAVVLAAAVSPAMHALAVKVSSTTSPVT